MKDYRLMGSQSCEVREIQKLERSLATWNFFWLSVPDIDKVPDTGENWWRHYKPAGAAFGAIVVDVIEDEVLYRKLLMHPAKFLDWFSRERDHTVYDSYDTFGERSWVNTVITRAEQAAERLVVFKPMKIDWADMARARLVELSVDSV